MRVVLKRAAHFITCNGKFIGSDNPALVKRLLTTGEEVKKTEQLSFFDKISTLPSLSALYGEL